MDRNGVYTLWYILMNKRELLYKREICYNEFIKKQRSAFQTNNNDKNLIEMQYADRFINYNSIRSQERDENHRVINLTGDCIQKTGG